MKIGIIGAGAIGTWVGSKIAAAGHDVAVLARGATLEAIRAHGLRLREPERDTAVAVRVSENAAELGVVDVLVIAVKGPALADAARAGRTMVGAETIIVPMINGIPWWFLDGQGAPLATPLHAVDPDGSITANMPAARVIGCVVHGSCSVPEPGMSVVKKSDRIIVGEINGSGSGRLERVAALIRDSGLPAEVSGAIRQDVWYKLWGNMTMNPISAVTGATCDRILDDPLVEHFVLAIMGEAAALGGKIGCPINESGADRNRVTRRLGAFKTSMLQDVEAGRSIELDLQLSAPREIAQRLGMPTPFMDALLGLARLFGQSHGLYPRPPTA
jgi:2-dehydropantoate 2-reductase